MPLSPTLNAKALAAFGRNDLRGTYRDPLLVMIVAAPVIWTTGVAVLTPLFTDMLADRYQFDLVPYYPLILTAFLLLTSIIIVGGLAAFLVLDEIDAGTLTVLRVTPVPLSTLFTYRAATVMGIAASPLRNASNVAKLSEDVRTTAGMLRETSRQLAKRASRRTGRGVSASSSIP